MCKQKIAPSIARFVLDLHDTKVIHSSVVDWIKPITLEKYNLQLFSTTECVLNNILPLVTNPLFVVATSG
jgi:hypothetical protein